jgi:hypothetical protein
MDITVELLNELKMKEGNDINYYMFDMKGEVNKTERIGNSNF